MCPPRPRTAADGCRVVSSGARAQACVQREGWERRVGSVAPSPLGLWARAQAEQGAHWGWIRSCREFLRFWSRNVGAAHRIGMPLTASKYSAPLLRYCTERIECLLDRACKAGKVGRGSCAIVGAVCELHLRHGVTAGSSRMSLETAVAAH